MTKTQRYVLITGATGGLGSALTHAFYQAGYSLLLHARHQPDTFPVAATWITGDLAEETTLMRLEEAIATHRPDVLINNAATQGPIGPTWELDTTAIEHTLRINLMVPMRLCQMVIPHMIVRNQGTIINISGGGATSPRPNFTSYATSKAALVRYSECLAKEVGEYGINVNCVAPGAMRTNMTASLIAAGERAGSKELQSAQALADTQQIIDNAAALCLHLASPETHGLSGKLISAVWDDWKHLEEHKMQLMASDVYTLRRVVPS